jgi:hypothetical protein
MTTPKRPRPPAIYCVVTADGEIVLDAVNFVDAYEWAIVFAGVGEAKDAQLPLRIIDVNGDTVRRIGGSR